LHAEKPVTRLLVDKLSSEQADSIIRAVQRAMIVRALHKEWELSRDQVTDDEVRELREIALGHAQAPSSLAQRLGKSAADEEGLVEILRKVYRVSRQETSLQMERIGRLGFSIDEQVRYVSNALLSTGLHKNFSRFVLMVGHESQTQNNPYESALDCGACGGGRGLPNARVICAMANQPEVRRLLRENKGIDIPEDTWFIAAVHNTTTDEISLHDLDLLPARHLLYLERLRNGLAAATRRTAAERMPTLGGSTALASDPYGAAAMARRHAHDWSQVRPEWGLSRNLYGIIGGRHLTEGVNLEGRSFLQSYDYRLDPKGRFLENILSAPVVVGEGGPVEVPRPRAGVVQPPRQPGVQIPPRPGRPRGGHRRLHPPPNPGAPERRQVRPALPGIHPPLTAQRVGRVRDHAVRPGRAPRRPPSRPRAQGGRLGQTARPGGHQGMVRPRGLLPGRPDGPPGGLIGPQDRIGGGTEGVGAPPQLLQDAAHRLYVVLDDQQVVLPPGRPHGLLVRRILPARDMQDLALPVWPETAQGRPRGGGL
jgi:hypothetical protein